MAVTTTPKGNNIYQSFLGFTYKDASGNMWHSITDLKIYRTSNGNRYSESITPAMTDKVVDVPGGDGQYYFGTTFKNRTFTVDYAFEELTKTEIDIIKMVFSGDGIHELVFDEDRDTDGKALKIWSAKVTGTATMKHLCLEEKGKDVYKGEGSITFTCYYPYAKSENKGTSYSSDNTSAIQNKGDLPAPFFVEIEYKNDTENTEEFLGIALTVKSDSLTDANLQILFSTTKKVPKNTTINYQLDSNTGIIREKVGT